MIYFNIFYILHYIFTFFKIVSASKELERRSKTSDSDKKNKRGNNFEEGEDIMKNIKCIKIYHNDFPYWIIIFDII